MMRNSALLLLVGLWLSGCVPGALIDRSGVDLDMTPQQVSLLQAAPEGTVNWGGRIIDIRSAGESTELEILGFPLSRSGVPDSDRDSEGRFIAVRDGFVDPLVFDKGRLITVVGRLSDIRDGYIDGRGYRWPVLLIVDLAPVPEQRRRGIVPFFSIGIGIGL